MNPNSASPYRPPVEIAEQTLDQGHVSKKETLSATGMAMAMLALLGPLIVCVFAIVRIIDVPWGSGWLLTSTFVAGMLTSIIALVVSIVARLKYGSKKSVFGIIAAILAIPTTLVASWLLAMIGLANCPV